VIAETPFTLFALSPLYFKKNDDDGDEGCFCIIKKNHRNVTFSFTKLTNVIHARTMAVF
jgi:hypothetical protein